MTQLHIALQEGFDHDEVLVRVNGKDAARLDSVSTRLQVGLAEELEVNVGDDPVQIELEVVSRSLRARTEVRAAPECYVGYSIRDGKVVQKVAHEPFGYV